MDEKLFSESPKYKRILLKLSGEALGAGNDGIINKKFIYEIASVVKKCQEHGVEVAILVGGGNIWRGKLGTEMKRYKADQMGMLATVINSMAIAELFTVKGVEAVALSSVQMDAFNEFYTAAHAKDYLNKGTVVVLGGGLGVPYITTDTAAMLRGIEIGADAVLMAKNIDGVYSDDPKSGRAGIIKYDEITYEFMIEKSLHAIDTTASSLAIDNNMKTYLFELKAPDNIYKIVMGEKIGTEIHN